MLDIARCACTSEQAFRIIFSNTTAKLTSNFNSDLHSLQICKLPVEKSFCSLQHKKTISAANSYVSRSFTRTKGKSSSNARHCSSQTFLYNLLTLFLLSPTCGFSTSTVLDLCSLVHSTSGSWMKVSRTLIRLSRWERSTESVISHTRMKTPS